MDTSGESLPVFLSTHPDPGEREENVAQLANKWQRKTGLKNYQINRNTYLRKIDGLIYGDDPRQGYVDNNTFFHPELKFSFPIPNGWALENTPQQVNMISPSKDAIIVLGLSGEKDLDNAARALVDRYGLQNVAAQRTRIRDFDALNLHATQTSQNQALRLSIFLIRYDGRIYEFISATTPQQFSMLVPVAESVATGFNELTDQSRLNVQPRRIAIREANSTTTLGRALSSEGVPEEKLQEHASLNGMELKETIEQGTLFKVLIGRDLSGVTVKRQVEEISRRS
jgi:predicted Zn-dependent protease